VKRYLSELCAGDEVAVLLAGSDNPDDTILVAQLFHVGGVYLELTNGWLYSANDGVGLNGGTYIVPAMNAHRKAVTERGSSNSLEYAGEIDPRVAGGR
jgi:hypothetical protein